MLVLGRPDYIIRARRDSASKELHSGIKPINPVHRNVICLELTVGIHIHVHVHVPIGTVVVTAFGKNVESRRRC